MAQAEKMFSHNSVLEELTTPGVEATVASLIATFGWVSIWSVHRAAQVPLDHASEYLANSDLTLGPDGRYRAS